MEKYVYITTKYSKPFVDQKGLKILWCKRVFKVLGAIEGAWIIRNYR